MTSSYSADFGMLQRLDSCPREQRLLKHDCISSSSWFAHATAGLISNLGDKTGRVLGVLKNTICYSVSHDESWTCVWDRGCILRSCGGLPALHAGNCSHHSAPGSLCDSLDGLLGPQGLLGGSLHQRVCHLHRGRRSWLLGSSCHMHTGCWSCWRCGGLLGLVWPGLALGLAVPVGDLWGICRSTSWSEAGQRLQIEHNAAKQEHRDPAASLSAGKWNRCNILRSRDQLAYLNGVVQQEGAC